MHYDSLIGNAAAWKGENQWVMAKTGRNIMGKAEYQAFDVLTYLNSGKNMLSGGIYGKYRLI